MTWTKSLATAKDAQYFMSGLFDEDRTFVQPQTAHSRLLGEGRTYYDYHAKDGEFLYRKFRIEKNDGTKKFPIFVKSSRGNFVWSQGTTPTRTLPLARRRHQHNYCL